MTEKKPTIEELQTTVQIFKNKAAQLEKTIEILNASLDRVTIEKDAVVTQLVLIRDNNKKAAQKQAPLKTV